MAEPQPQYSAIVVLLLLCLTPSAGCGSNARPAAAFAEKPVLRIGLGQVLADDPQAGLRQIAQLLSVESLVNFRDDGHPRPWLAQGWTVAHDGLSVTVRLRPQVTFHDGTPVDASTVVKILTASLPKNMGPVFDDIQSIAPSGETAIVIKLKKPSPLVIEALETSIRRPDKTVVGTGPFMNVATLPQIDLRANPNYYLGKPHIDRVVVTSFPNVRAAWADMLRGRIDMLFEVGADAMESLESTSAVSVYTFTRRYQYMVLLNSAVPILHSSEFRRALNYAIDRKAVVKNGLNGHGMASTGPLWPGNWAMDPDVTPLQQNLTAAQRTLEAKATPSHRVILKCLVPVDSIYERVSLELKRQLEPFNVDLELEEAPSEEFSQRLIKHDYQMLLLDAVSGPTLFRLYQWWHTGGAQNWTGYSSPAVDVALDQVRSATDDAHYRAGVAAFQRAMLDDPPAIFLAWGERARAVSNRFVVPAEPGRDILPTMYTWRPRTDMQMVSRN